MKLINNVWILIFLLSFNGVFAFADVQTDFSDNQDELFSIEEMTEGKSNISPADLPGFISTKNIVNLSNFSLKHFIFSAEKYLLVPKIFGKKSGIISILFTSKIIYPFHSFL